jgi:magnesium transporter
MATQIETLGGPQFRNFQKATFLKPANLLTMLTVRLLRGTKLMSGGLELLSAPEPKWIDLSKPDEPSLNALSAHYGLHKLAVEDCLHLDQRPKIEEYHGLIGVHQFIVLQGFSLIEQETNQGLLMHELHMFLGSDFLITVHESVHPCFDELLMRIENEPAQTFARGLDYLAYLCADGLVDTTFPVLEHFNETIERLEDRLFSEKSTRSLIQQAFHLKRLLVQLRRVMSPQRDVLGLLSRNGISQVSDRTTLYFRDVYDHLFRLAEHIDSTRDLLGNVMDAYLSVIANRTGEISKQLTIFASIFMPLSFVVGFFGQNFDQLAQWPLLGVMLGLMLAIPAAMILWFRHKDWL